MFFYVDTHRYCCWWRIAAAAAVPAPGGAGPVVLGVVVAAPPPVAGAPTASAERRRWGKTCPRNRLHRRRRHPLGHWPWNSVDSGSDRWTAARRSSWEVPGSAAAGRRRWADCRWWHLWNYWPGSWNYCGRLSWAGIHSRWLHYCCCCNTTPRLQFKKKHR